jgi:hypothetical protein
MIVASDVGGVSRVVGTGVPVDLISEPVGLVHPAKSAQRKSPNKADMTRVFCILSAFIFVYF